MPDPAKRENPFSGTGLFHVTPEHPLLGDGDRELPFLSDLDLTLLVLARVIGVGVIASCLGGAIFCLGSVVFRLGGFRGLQKSGNVKQWTIL